MGDAFFMRCWLMSMKAPVDGRRVKAAQRWRAQLFLKCRPGQPSLEQTTACTCPHFAFQALDIAHSILRLRLKVKYSSTTNT